MLRNLVDNPKGEILPLECERDNFMNNVLQGPWKTKPDVISKYGGIQNFKVDNFFESISKQKLAHEAGIYTIVYLINGDYARTFLIMGEQSETEKQMVLHSDPEVINKIKESFKRY